MPVPSPEHCDTAVNKIDKISVLYSNWGEKTNKYSVVTGSDEDRLYWACGQRGLELRKCGSTWVPEFLVVTDVNKRHNR